MKILDFFYKLIALLLSIFVFWGYALGNSYPFIGVIMVVAIIILAIQRKKIIISANIFKWIFFSVLLIIGAFKSNDFSASLSYTLTFFIIVVLAFLLSNIKDETWYRYFIFFSTICGLIHVLGTLIYSNFPQIIQPICAKLLSPVEYLNNLELYNNRGNPGLTGQTGVNGWFISLTIGFLIIYLIKEQNKKTVIYKGIIFSIIILSIIALILTNKRSYILFSFTAIFMVLMLYNRKKIKFKNLCLIFISTLIILQIISSNVQLLSVFERFSDNGSDDISTGRFKIYSYMLELFDKNWVTGIGTLSILKYVNNYGHNIYIQLLCENGIIVLGYFIFLIINTIKYTMTEYKKKILSNYFKMAISLYIQLLFVLYGLTGNPLYTIQDYTVFLISIGYINKIYIEKEKDNEKRSDFNIYKYN